MPRRLCEGFTQKRTLDAAPHTERYADSTPNGDAVWYCIGLGNFKMQNEVFII
jgi:hypothetical protein